MKEKILLFFKGMLLGMAMIIPGVSGGTLAISLGLYEKIIHTISHFFKNFKENFLFIINLGLGMLSSLIICAFILNYTFKHFPIPTTLFFIGLIIGSVPLLFKKIKIKKTINITNIILLILSTIFLLVVSKLQEGDSKDVVFTSFTLIQTLKLLGVGFVAAATLVIPGISGSLMLMVLGYYNPILEVITDTIKLNNIANNLLILIPFGVGIIIGVIVIVKIIEYFIKKYEIKTYYVIIGFLISSIIIVFSKLCESQITANTIQIILGVLFLLIGSILSLKLLKND